MNTIIGIPAMSSFQLPDDSWDEQEEDEETIDSPDVYEKPYSLLFDGVTEALNLLKAGEYDKAKDRLIRAQVEADEAVCED